MAKQLPQKLINQVVQSIVNAQLGPTQQIAAQPTMGTGNVPIPAAIPGDFSNQIATSTVLNKLKPVLDTATIAQATGKDWTQLSPDVQARLNSLYNIQSSSGQLTAEQAAHETLNGILSGGKSVLNRVGDVLSRPLYAVVEGEKELGDAIGSGDWAGALPAWGHGAWEGISGQKKTTWSDFIQHINDISNAEQNMGLSGKEAIDYANAEGQGQGTTPGIVKWGVGLPLDIIADPLNFVGLGEVNKVIRGPAIVDHINTLAEAARRGAKLGVGPTEVNRVLTAAEKDTLRSNIISDMALEGKHLDAGKIAKSLLKSKKITNPAEAQRVAEDIVAKNTTELDKRLSESLDRLTLKPTDSLDYSMRNQILRTKLGLGVKFDESGKFRPKQRKVSPTLTPSQMKTQLSSGLAAIEDIVKAERDAHVAEQLKSVTRPGEVTSNLGLLSARSQKEADIIRKLTEAHDARAPKIDLNALGAHPEAASAVSKLLEEEFKKHPELQGSIREVTATHTAQGVSHFAGPGRASHVAGEVRLNLSDISKELHDRELRHVTEHGMALHAGDTTSRATLAASIAAHEIGHQWAHLAGLNTRKGLSDLLTHLQEKHPKFKWTQRNIATKISRVAAERHVTAGELIAEAFAAERMGKGNVYTKSIVDFVENRAKRNFATQRESRIINDFLKQIGRTPNVLKAAKAKDLAKVKADKERYAQETKRVLSEADKIAEERRLNLENALHQVLNPKVERRLGLHLLGTTKAIALPGVGKLLKPVVTAANSDNIFNKSFRATVGAPKEVIYFARAAMGKAQYTIEQQRILLNDTYRGVTTKTNKRVVDNLLEGTHGVFNPKGEDLVKHFEEQVKAIEDDLKSLIPDRMIPQLLDSTLPRQLKLSNDKGLKLWTTASKDTLHENFLLNTLKEIIKVQRKATSVEHPVKTFFESPAQILMSLRAAAEQAKTIRLMRFDLVNTFGHEADGPLAQQLKARGYKEARIYSAVSKEEFTPYDLKGILFHPEVAKGIEDIHRAMYNQKYLNDILRTYDRGLRVFKQAVTKFNPGYYERNLFGEVFTGALGGVVNPFVYGKAMRVLWKHDRRFLDPARTEKASRRAVKAANALQHNDPAKAARLLDEATPPVAKPVLNFHGRNLYEDEVWHLFINAGLHTGFISTDIGQATVTGRFSKIAAVTSKIGEKTQTTSEALEDFARLAHFIDALGKSKIRNLDNAVREAAGEVRKFHHDFADFTEFENSVMARLVPFYKWTRKNIPLMAETIFTRPGKADKLFTVPAAISNAIGYQNDPRYGFPLADPIEPEWLVEDRAIPVGTLNGDTQFLDLPLPLLDALKFANHPAQSLEFMTTPPLKVLADISRGHTVGGQAMPTWQQYLAQQTPNTNLGFKLNTQSGKLSNLLQFLTGIGLQPNTDRRMLSAAIRAQQAAAAKRKQLQGR